MSPAEKSASVTKEDASVIPAREKREADHAAHNINSTVKQMTENTHEAVDKAAKAVNSTANVLSEKGNEIKEARASNLKELRGKIKSNPMGSIGIAIAIGFIASWLLAAIF
jgi:ElaB/YqjD/DUF883 family membrane-anchored ribosome-binding protein